MDEHLVRWNDEMYAAHPTPYNNNISGLIQKARVAAVIRLADIHPDDSVLELGCESGGLILNLPDCQKRIGVDISGQALEQADEIAKQRCLNNINFRQLDAQNPLPFEQGSFNVIIASELLEHVHQPQKVIENIYALSNPDTRIVITIPLERPKLIIKKILGKLGIMSLLFPGIEKGPSEWHLQNFSKKMLMQMVSGLFSVVKTKNVWGCHYAVLMHKK